MLNHIGKLSHTLLRSLASSNENDSSHSRQSPCGKCSFDTPGIL